MARMGGGLEGVEGGVRGDEGVEVLSQWSVEG